MSAAASAPMPPATDENASAPAPAAEASPRKPFGAREPRLDVSRFARPGYVQRWFNDYHGRIDRAKEAGYVHINENGKPKKMVVDRSSGLEAYAMEIPQEFYDEDFSRKQANLDQLDEAIIRKPIADQGYRPTIGNTDQPRSSMKAVTGRTPFQQ